MSIKRSVGRFFFTIALLGAAGWLFVNAYASYQLRGRVPDFILKSPLASFFSAVWLFRGNYLYFEENDPSAAARCYRKAVSIEPSFIDPWIGLARADLASGKKEEARQILRMILPVTADVGTWKWDELQLDYGLGDNAAFSACFNYILVHLPDHVDQACRLAAEFWGGWGDASARVLPGGRTVFLNRLIGFRKPGAALILWKQMLQAGPVPDRKMKLRFCQFLLDCGRIGEAKKVWSEWEGNGCPELYNGGFEQAPLNTAFGWRIAPERDFLIERTSREAYRGKWCLHLRFSGKKNLVLNRTLRIIPVEPGRDYVLEFAQKARSLTTDQGVYLAVVGYGCKGLDARSKPVTGTIGWTGEKIDVPVPKGCEAVALQICRNESLKFDCDISGDYWLDAVKMDIAKPGVGNSH